MKLLWSKYDVTYGLVGRTVIPAGQIKLCGSSGTVATFSSLEECDLCLAVIGLRHIGDFRKAGEPGISFWYDECRLEEI